MFFRRILPTAAAMMILAAAPVSAEPGFVFDPSTGMFRAAPELAPAGATRAVAARAGRYEFTIAVTQSFPAPAGAIPTCVATVGAFGSGGTSYQESGTYVATAGGGKSWTCKVLIPYSWPQVETSAPVQLSIMVFSGEEGSKARSHLRLLPPARMPANGAVTRISQAVTL